jgi:membrane protein
MACYSGTEKIVLLFGKSPILKQKITHWQNAMLSLRFLLYKSKFHWLESKTNVNEASMHFRDIWALIKDTFSEWGEDKAPRLSAALAYYTAFSLAPILVIVIAIVGLVLDRGTVQESVIQQVGGLAGSGGADLIRTMLEASQDFGSNLIAMIIGIVALIFGATGVFGALQDALNTMWEVAPKPKQGILGFIKSRFFSFAMVIVVGFLLLVSLVISAALVALNEWSLALLPGFEVVFQILNVITSFLVITLLFALLFKYVPDAEIKWRDVWLGAAITALLFSIGKQAIGLYLGNSDPGSKFGGAGALVIILLWVYYSAMILFLGAEFTQVYANTFGSKVVPAEDAVLLTEERRTQQGIPHKEQLQEDQVRASPGTVFAAYRLLSPVPGPIQDPINPRADLSLLALVSVISTLVGVVGGYLLKLDFRKSSRSQAGRG